MVGRRQGRGGGFRGWGRIAVALLLVAASGAAGALAGFRSIKADGASAITNGQWQIDPALASAASSARTRAYLAKFGLLGLPSSEAVYFLANTVDGKPLNSSKTYRITGRDLPGAWWSLTLYGADQFLIPNAQNRYSVRSSDIIREPDGSYVVSVSRNPQPGNWIPAGEGHDMSLLLRVYHPDAALLDHLDTVPLPTIREGEPGHE